MTKKKKFNIGDFWNDLPKWVKILPYIAVSGGLASLIKYLSEVQLSDALMMGVINIAIVVLKQSLDLLKKK